MATAKSEQQEIDRDGATAQPNSGRGKIKKGDAKLEPFLIDYKEYAVSFGVTQAIWAKVSKDAITCDMMQPALKLVIGPEGEPKTRLWVISDKMFHEMREAWLKEHG